MRILFLLTAHLTFPAALLAAPQAVDLPKWASESFASPVAWENIDTPAYAEWVAGQEKPIISHGDRSLLPEWTLWTGKSNPGHRPASFGDSKQAGPRHLRFGFKKSIAVGSVLAMDGGSLSVLKRDAPYPGDLGNEDHWQAATRMVDGQPTTSETAEGDFALWVLPPGTETRALRFTHIAKITDEEYAGKLSGVMVLPERFTNQAWNATAGASTNNQNAKRIVNGNHDNWGTWYNQEKGKAPEDSPVISEDHPQWLTLTWREPVAVDALVAIWAGIATAEVQTYTGSADRNPRYATGADWQSLASFTNIQHNYATRFWPNKLAFEKTVKTRALRIRITRAGEEKSHAGNNEGKRAWLGELMAIRDIGSEQLEATPETTGVELPHPPIPIDFHLEEAGYVTLVIERPDGFRVRNLVSETWFPAGDNTAWWDACDDLARDADAAQHGVYHIPVRFVEPGPYRVRGLVRGKIDPHYEFSVYTTGNPPWPTEDHTGAWLANHSPPQAAAFIPAAQSPTGEDVVYLGSYVTEGPDGLAWVDLDGKKLGGKKWIGGHWTAAPFLGRDAGPEADADTHVYVASAWPTQKGSGIGELRVSALTRSGDREILIHNIGEIGKGDREWNSVESQVGGIAVHNQIAVIALTRKNLLLFIDTKAGKIIAETKVEAPMGIAVEPADGSLLVLSGTQLLRFPAGGDFSHPSEPEPLITTGLGAPAGITLDDEGAIYISDWGNSHQVKIFTAAGKAVRSIGHPGAPKAGQYDPLHMNHPQGIAVDSRGNIWVTEHDYIPKRVSVWSADGKLVNAFYGPGKYGGGGALDPRDKSKFYYADETKGAMEFQLDWQKGSWELTNVLTRESADDMQLAFRSGAPEQAIYYRERRYFSNSYNSSPTGGHSSAYIFSDKDGITQPCAAMGNAKHWDLLNTEPFKSRWPEGTDFTKQQQAEALFVWSDLNDDAHAQPDEVTMIASRGGGGIIVNPDLSFSAARVNERSLQFHPTSFTASGVPVYDLSQSSVLATEVKNPKSSGGDQVLAGSDGWSAVTLGIGPFDAHSLSGAKDGIAKWSYPSPWPGLHASHLAPRPDRPGQLIGTTRLPGGFFKIEGSDIGPLWAIHSNHGMMYVFTQDGLFVATLFDDMRVGFKWRMPNSERNMDLAGLSLGEENFWPTLSHCSDGKVYLVDGNRSAIIRLDGLDSIRRLPASELTLSKADLEKSRAWQIEAEAARQSTLGSGTLSAATDLKPTVDGDLSDWAKADWVDIDKSGVKAYFNADTKPYDITGSVAAAGERLYVAWKTDDPKLLKNSGEMPVAPFKTGGALDLMLGPDGDRDQPVAGDLRLIVTLVDEKPWALLYRAVVPGTQADDKVPFSSPWRTITFDRVDDVTDQLEFAASDGNYEISIPCETLGLAPGKGTKLRGDIGILRGNGSETKARVYWSNKATAITADVPSEAMLTPKLWGRIEFR